MRLNILKPLVPIVILAMLVIALVTRRSDLPTGTTDGQASNLAIELNPSRFLIKPYFVKPDKITIAFDGGEIPIPNAQLPSIVLGSNVLRTVHLSWVHDWSAPETRESFKALQALYESDEAASLPALRIYLNPVFSSPEGEAIQHAMLQVFFRAKNRDLYQMLAKEISTGVLASDLETIWDRVEAIEPLHVTNWNTQLEWLENDIQKTFSVAKAQQARNAKILDPSFKAQLTSMLDILDPSSDVKEIIAFIEKANTAQRTWLHSQSGIPNEKLK